MCIDTPACTHHSSHCNQHINNRAAVLLDFQVLLKFCLYFATLLMAVCVNNHRCAHRYPSLGYMIDQGATTLWEAWDGTRHVVGGGGGSSRNHIMFGELGGFFFRFCHQIVDAPAIIHLSCYFRSISSAKLRTCLRAFHLLTSSSTFESKGTQLITHDLMCLYVCPTCVHALTHTHTHTHTHTPRVIMQNNNAPIMLMLISFPPMQAEALPDFFRQQSAV